MKKAILLSFTIIFLSSCLQTENSNSLDADNYAPVTTDGGESDEFLAAKQVLSTNCSSCHAYHNQSEDQLIAAGVVVAGDPEGSALFYRLSNSTGSNGPKNMPPTGALVDSDIQIIFDWIDTL